MYSDFVEAHSCVYRYNMKLTSNTAAFYPNGCAGRFKLWLLHVNFGVCVGGGVCTCVHVDVNTCCVLATGIWVLLRQ